MSTWLNTGTQNLVKNAQSGRYYARFTVGGKLKWVSLHTTKKTVAALRLTDERTKQDKMRMALSNVTAGTATMGQLKEIWKQQKLDNVRLGERTRTRQVEYAKAISRSWPEFDKLSPDRVTRAAVEEWRNKIHASGTGFVNPLAASGKAKPKGLSSGTINKLLDCLKQMLDIAVERGQLATNPLAMRGLKLAVTPKKPDLPEPAVLLHIYGTIESYAGCNSPHSADFCRLLNFTGMRVSEAAALRWKHVDFRRGMIKVPGTKTEAAQREVPMMKESLNLFTKLHSQAEAKAKTAIDGVAVIDPESKVSPVSEATVSLRNACKKLNISPPLTHHDLRDAFATSCIEAGVDIPTVAAWLGHKDGGALLMRTYAHHRRKHSQAQAAKVSFGGVS